MLIFDQHFHGLILIAPVDACRDTLVLIVEQPPAAFLLFFRHVVFHLACGDGAGPRRIFCQVRHVELQLFQQINRALELIVGLARKADDHIGRNRRVGNPGADLLDQAAIVVGGIAALHVAQNFVIAGLHRHFDVLADLRQLGHRVEQLVVHPIRMRGQEANTLDAVNAVDHAQQIGQIGAVAEILAIAIDDLAQERHFLHALRRQRADFARDVADRPAALDAAPKRDDAERAGVRAAVHDRDVGRHQRAALVCGQDQVAVLNGVALARFSFEQRERFTLAQIIDERRGFRGGHEHIDPRELLLECAVALDADHAAHDGDDRLRLFLLDGLERLNVAISFVFGALAHDARVEHDHVRVARVIRVSQADLLQFRPDPLGIGLIHLAAEDV